MGNPFGRNVILPLTNHSGASVAAGDLVYLDTTQADSFLTGTTSAYTGGIGIAQQAIGSGSVGLVLVSGYAALVNVNASVTLGHFGTTYTVAKQATDAGTSRIAGTFCQFLTGGTTPDAMVWQPDLGGGSGMANPMTTKGDVILGDTGGTPTRLGAGTSGYVLTSAGAAAFPTWSAPPATGAQALPLDNAAAAAVGSGDLFAGTSLDGGWTSLQTTALTSIDRAQANWAILKNSTNTAGVDRGLQRAFAPAGDFTVYAKIGNFSQGIQYVWSGIFAGAATPGDGAGGNRISLFMLWTSAAISIKFAKYAAGVETSVFNDTISSTVWGGAIMPSLAGSAFKTPAWLRIRRTGSTLYGGVSWDGVEFLEDSTTTTIGFTVATCGLILAGSTLTSPIQSAVNWIATTG